MSGKKEYSSGGVADECSTLKIHVENIFAAFRNLTAF